MSKKQTNIKEQFDLCKVKLKKEMEERKVVYKKNYDFWYKEIDKAIKMEDGGLYRSICNNYVSEYLESTDGPGVMLSDEELIRELNNEYDTDEILLGLIDAGIVIKDIQIINLILFLVNRCKYKQVTLKELFVLDEIHDWERHLNMGVWNDDIEWDTGKLNNKEDAKKGMLQRLQEILDDDEKREEFINLLGSDELNEEKIINNKEQINLNGDTDMSKKQTNKETNKEPKQTKRHMKQGRKRRTKAEIEAAKQEEAAAVEAEEEPSEEKYVTREEFEDLVSEQLHHTDIVWGDDLDDYVTKDDLDDYVTTDDLSDLGYVTNDDLDLDDYVTNDEFNDEVKELNEQLEDVYERLDNLEDKEPNNNIMEPEDVFGETINEHDQRIKHLEEVMEKKSDWKLKDITYVKEIVEENKKLRADYAALMTQHTKRMEEYDDKLNMLNDLVNELMNNGTATNNNEVNELKQRVSDLEAQNKEFNEKINLFEFEHNHMLNSNQEVLDAVSNISEHTTNIEENLKEQKIYNEVKDKNISELRATIINQELTINNLNERFGIYIYKQQQREKELNTVKGATKNLIKAAIVTPINKIRKSISNYKINRWNKQIQKLNKLKEQEMSKYKNEEGE